MKIYFAAFVVFLLNSSAFGFEVQNEINCYATFGYEVNALVTDGKIDKVSMTYGDEVILRNNKSARQFESSDGQAAWRIDLIFQRRSIILKWPPVVRTNEFAGTLTIAAPSISAHFPLKCKLM